jgi:hypothetical protein
MPKFRLLLLDANVIIYAHELGIWHLLTDRCEITVTRTVAEQEVYYWRDRDGGRHEIDLATDIQEGRVRCIEVPLARIDAFRERFSEVYLDAMDPGETESLAFLESSADPWRLCSSDAIVFRVLGSLGRAEQGISLEEVLSAVGLERQVDAMYDKTFRQRYTARGRQEAITGLAAP